MIESLLSAKPYVSVAIAFDEHAVPLIRLGATLAKRLGKKLCLMHATDPALAVPVQPFAVPALLWEAIPEYVASGKEEAKKRLEELKRLVPDGIETKLSVTEGRSADALAAEAERVGSCLLVVGATISEQKFLPSGFSTALSLLASCPVPVLAVDTERHIPAPDGPWRFLVADDLSAQSEPAVAVAAALGETGTKTQVHHVHVSAFREEDLKSALQGAALAARTTLGEKEAAEVYKGVKSSQLKVLESRFSDFREYIENAGGTYTAEVVAGPVGAELDQVVKAQQPDFMIFGRHHALHRKPFFFGRMPYKAMMAFHRPVLVVPGADEE